MPLVSVYIPTRNRVALAARAVGSVLTQSVADIEVIVVIDGSSDDSFDRLNKIACSDNRLKVIRNETSVGACQARNEAIQAAKAELVTGLDDDDYFLPNRVEALLSLWSDDVALIGAQDLINTRGKWSVTRRPPMLGRNDILMRNCFGNQGMFRRGVFQAIGGFDTALASSQDYDLWIRLIMSGKCRMHTEGPTQVVFDIARPDRITSQAQKDVRSRRHILEKYHPSMTFQQKSSHLSRIMAIERHPMSVAYSMAAFDMSVAGMRDVLRCVRSVAVS